MLQHLIGQPKRGISWMPVSGKVKTLETELE